MIHNSLPRTPYDNPHPMSFLLRYTTANIAHDAVAMASEENTASTALGVAPGESVQSKLQTLPNVGTVMITRTPYVVAESRSRVASPPPPPL